MEGMEEILVLDMLISCRAVYGIGDSHHNASAMPYFLKCITRYYESYSIYINIAEISRLVFVHRDAAEKRLEKSLASRFSF